jgi:hypothetical protein
MEGLLFRPIQGAVGTTPAGPDVGLMYRFEGRPQAEGGNPSLKTKTISVRFFDDQGLHS